MSHLKCEVFITAHSSNKYRASTYKQKKWEGGGFPLDFDLVYSLFSLGFTHCSHLITTWLGFGNNVFWLHLDSKTASGLIMFKHTILLGH